MSQVHHQSYRMSLESYAETIGNDAPFTGWESHPHLAFATVAASISRTIVDRADEVLPSIPLAVSAPYIAAAWQHAAQGTESSLAALTACNIGAERITADDAQRCEVLAQLAPFTYAAEDAELRRVDGPPTRVRRATDGTVRGKLPVSVIGQDEVEYKRSEAGDLIRRADMWLHAAGTPIPLIGSDPNLSAGRCSWEQVVNYRPDVIDLGDAVTLNGAPIGPIVLAPYGAGDSIQGGDSTRRRPAHRPTSVSYLPRPVETCHVPMWTVDGAAMRVVKRYATSAAIVRTVGNMSKRSTSIGGVHGWQHPIPRKSKSGKVRNMVPRAQVRRLPMDELVKVLTYDHSQAFTHRQDETTTAIVDGARVTVRHTPTDRAWRVSVTLKDESGKARQHSRKVRSVSAMVAAVQRLATAN